MDRLQFFFLIFLFLCSLVDFDSQQQDELIHSMTITMALSSISLHAVITAIIATFIALWISKSKEAACFNDPPILLSGFSAEVNVSVYPCQHIFSETYTEARASFRKAVDQIKGAERRSFVVVPNTDLTMDIAVIEGNTPGLMIHSSGVHGVEGFAGSAIQIAYLRGLLLEQQESTFIQDRPTIILVHAVNPSGMSNFRRFNENNVDLNRNALGDEEWKTYALNHFNRDNYDRFNEMFNPSHAPTWFTEFAEFWLRSIPALALHGFPSLKAALVGGQYHQPKGVFYGGRQLELSHRILQDFLTNYLTNKNNHEGEKVTWVDVHTGLGKSGKDTILLDSTNDGAEIHWFPGADSVFEDASGTAKFVSQGYENVKGTVHTYYGGLFQKEQQPMLFCQEFGTLPGILVGKALMIENMAYQYCSDNNEKLRWAMRTTKRAFYPQSVAWRKNILQRGVVVLLQAAKRSASLSKHAKTNREAQ